VGDATMIKLEELQALVQLMVDNDLTELELRDGEESVCLKRGGPSVVAAAAAAPTAAVQSGAPSPGVEAPAPAPPAEVEDDGLVAIESPMVGTFYASPDPDSPPFVQVGSSVTPETVVCLVEAMKVFNEVKAETTGVIERVLVKNGEAVEFGQPLFLVRPQ